MARRIAARCTLNRRPSSWSQVRADSFEWFATAELAYANAAFVPGR
jgi:hypothetical protein